MTKKDCIRIVLNLWRLWMVDLAFAISNEKNKISMDIDAWNRVKHFQCSKKIALWKYMLDYKEFRNLFLHRIRNRKIKYFVKAFFPPLDSLYIACPDIGGGLFIQHGFSTIIACKKIGENCWINQQVTIGYKGESAPIIGNHVSIYCQSAVIGGVILEDGSTVGAGAIVTKSVKAGVTVVGNPAREIKRVSEQG